MCMYPKADFLYSTWKKGQIVTQTEQSDSKYAHFKDKGAIEHVAEAQARGMISSTEIHGTEIPGHISAGADSARETGVILLLLWLLLSSLNISFMTLVELLLAVSFGWIIWKSGRSAWLAWSRLERMHRIVEQERWEIKHHRQQEREELTELYQAKGFHGKLLEDVIDVLMADEDRLLRVMVEEELCLSVGTQEHPLKQSLGAAIGTTAAAMVCLAFLFAFPSFGMWVGALLSLSVAAGVSAYFERNRLIPAITWNLGIGFLAIGSSYFLYQYIQ